MNRVKKTQEQLDGIIDGLDVKLNRVLAKQEYEYLKGYNIYVKRKEKELRDLIEKLNEKNSNNTLKDEKINNLERTIHAIRKDQIKLEEQKDQQKKETLKWKTKAQGLEEDRKFLEQQIKDAKRQNKLLKLAIGRLQNEFEKREAGGNTFLTEGGQGPAPGQEKTAQEKILDILKGEGGLDQLEPSQLIDTTA